MSAIICKETITPGLRQKVLAIANHHNIIVEEDSQTGGDDTEFLYFIFNNKRIYQCKHTVPGEYVTRELFFDKIMEASKKTFGHTMTFTGSSKNPSFFMGIDPIEPAHKEEVVPVYLMKTRKYLTINQNN